MRGLESKGLNCQRFKTMVGRLRNQPPALGTNACPKRGHTHGANTRVSVENGDRRE